MKQFIAISMLTEDLKSDVELRSLKPGFYIEFVNGESDWKKRTFGLMAFEKSDVDEMIGFLFEVSLTHYIDGYVPYGSGDGKSSSYSVFLNECGPRHKNTNISAEVIDLFKQSLEVCPNG